MGDEEETGEAKAPDSEEGSTLFQGRTRHDTIFEAALNESSELESLLEEIVCSPDTRIEIGERLGVGGMGRVDVGLDRGLRRQVARKIIAKHLCEQEDAVKLFLREAQISSQLEHPAIVPVHEVGRQSDQRVFFTMKVVDGQPLHAVVEEVPEGRLSSSDLQRLLVITIRVCQALELAHSRGVAHGDVKPSNVMVGEFGEVYLLDWGLATLLDDAQVEVHPLLASSTLLGAGGTAACMAPEQASGRAIGRHTDIFLVGALLFYCLTRSHPYPQETLAEKIRAARKGEWRREELEAAAPGLRRIVSKAMATDPAARHRSMSELRRELSTFLLGGGDLPRRVVATGEHVIREGEDAREVYVLEAGRVLVYRTINGRDVHVREMGEGAVFGEMATLTSSPRTASIVALEDCVVRVIDGEALERELEGMKPWLAALTQTLADRLREKEEELPS